jgi:hypothetical protein
MHLEKHKEFYDRKNQTLAFSKVGETFFGGLITVRSRIVIDSLQKGLSRCKSFFLLFKVGQFYSFFLCRKRKIILKDELIGENTCPKEIWQ